MLKKISILSLLSILVAPGVAVANDGDTDAVVSSSKTRFPHGLQIGVGLSGSSGLNGFVGYANKNFESFWAKRFGIRFDFATTKPIESALNSAIEEVMKDGIDIGDGVSLVNGELEAKHFAGLVDFYPFGDTWFLGGWRITGGYVTGDMKMNAGLAGSIDNLAVDGVEFDLAGQKFYYSGNSFQGDARLDWEYHGPYVGTGFDFGLFAGFKIYLDAGVVFTNRAAELSLDIPVENLYILNSSTGVWENVVSKGLQSSVDNAKDIALRDANDELQDFKFYPMVKLGFMYRF